MGISDIFNVGIDRYVSRLPRAASDVLSDVWDYAKGIPEAEAKNLSTFWGQVSTPLSDRVSARVGARRGPVDEIANFALEEATRPINYVPGLGLFGKAKAGAPAGLRLASNVLGPSVQGRLGRRLAGEAVANIGARAGSEAAYKGAEELGLGEKSTFALGLLGGLAGGSGAVGAISRSSRRNLPGAIRRSMVEDTRFEYTDPNDLTTSVLEGRLVPAHVMRETPAELDRLFGMSSLPTHAETELQYYDDLGAQDALREATRRAKEVGLDENDLYELQKWNASSENSTIRLDFAGGTERAQRLYRAGQDFREGLTKTRDTLGNRPDIPRQLVNPDNTITMYRGERRFQTTTPKIEVFRGTGSGSIHPVERPDWATPGSIDEQEWLETVSFPYAGRVVGDKFLVTFSPGYKSEHQDDILYELKRLSSYARSIAKDQDLELIEVTKDAFLHAEPTGGTPLGLARNYAPNDEMLPNLSSFNQVETLTGHFEPQIVESWTIDPQRAASFSASEGYGVQSYIIARDVPVQDIVAPIGSLEREVLVLNREKVDPDLYQRITGERPKYLPSMDPEMKVRYGIMQSLMDNELVKAYSRFTGKSLDDIADSVMNRGPIHIEEVPRLTGSQNGILQSQLLSLREAYFRLEDVQPPAIRADGTDADDVQPLSQKLIDALMKYGTPGQPFPGMAVHAQDADIYAAAKAGKLKFTPKMEARFANDQKLTSSQRNAIQKQLDAQSDVATEQALEGIDLAGTDTPLPEAPVAAAAGGAGEPPKPPPTALGGEAFDDDLFDDNLLQPEPKRQMTDPEWEAALVDSQDGIYQPVTFPDGTLVSEIDSPIIERARADKASKHVANRYLPLELRLAAEKAALERGKSGTVGYMDKINQTLKSVWATADMSWFGIQALLTLPRMVLKRDFAEIGDIAHDAMNAWWDPSTSAQRINRLNEVAARKGHPSVQDLFRKGLELQTISGGGDIGGGIFPGANRSFATAGDTARLAIAYTELDRYGIKALDDIIAVANRATGAGASGGFAADPAARMLLFAPRFLQSQLETVVKAASDRGLQGSLARKQLLAMAGVGITMTYAINTARGEETVMDPRDSNFLRIRNVGGTDISLFGPWDSLIRAAVAIGRDPKEGTQYLLRSKASPIVSTAWNIWSGRNFLGEKMTTEDHLKSLFLPFSAQDVGDEPPVASIAGFFGLKSSPLSAQDLLEDHMKEAGYNPNDPLDRRTWLVEHPEDLPKATGEDRELAKTITSEIGQRRALNDQLTTDGIYTLNKWRENRKILQREQRAKLDTVYAGRTTQPKNEKERWIKSWYDLFAQAADPVSGDPISDKLDVLQAEWMTVHGPDALAYVTAYNQVGRSELELEYLTSIAQLKSMGYFDISKYRRMKSGLTDDQIDSARSLVSGARSADPRLRRLEYAQAARRYLTDRGYSTAEIRDITNAGKKAYSNPAREKLKSTYPDLTMWFNPNATYDNLQVAHETAALRQRRSA